MLRRFLSVLNAHHPLAAFSKNTLLTLRMSSEGVNLSKRSPDEANSDESEAKKLKTENEVESVDEIINKAAAATNKVRKPKKVVLLLCYLGKEFYGMQRNSNVSTVEEELFKALLECNIILKSEFDFPKTMKFQRAARTDKGVSAVRQIVSLRLPVKEVTKELPEKVNKHLPPEIRLVGVKRVTQSFDAKIACDARTYSYMTPTFAFASKDEETTETYRITEERIKEINEFLKNYIGTHNFYNFTSGRLPGDPSCNRYIISCECGPPFMSQGIEFSVIKIKGQSFMLHQIRKMVGLAIAIKRNLTDLSILDKVWDKERIDIPKAPGLGLMLEELHYDWYNKKYGSDGMHEPLTWDEYNDVTEKFKMEKICANIAKTEREEKSMMQWLETLPHHSYDVRDAGPPTMLPSKETVADKNQTSVTPNDTEKTDISNVGFSNGDVKSVNIREDTSALESETTAVVCNKSTETEIKCES